MDCVQTSTKLAGAWIVCIVLLLQTSTKLAGEAVHSEPVSHWQSRLTINVVSERVSFDPRNIPGELYRYLQ